MKPIKNAEQHNVEVRTSCYTQEELKELANIKGVGELPFGIDPGSLRVFLSEVQDLKIVVKGGYYYNVAVMKSGETIYVEL